MQRKAYSYVRFSTPEQARGDSLRRQIAAAEAYAGSNGLTLDEHLTDAGLSAFRGQHTARGALGRFLAAVEEGAVPRGSVLIVESLDRLSREDVLAALEQLTALIRAGISIVTLSDGQEYSRETILRNHAQLIISLTIMSRAHEESAQKGLRVGAAWQEKRRKAAEEGIGMSRRCVAWCTLDGPRYVLREDRASIVRRIYEMSAGGIGQASIASWLNREQVPIWGPGASGWRPSYVKKILGNKASYGLFQPHKKVCGKRVPDGPAIPDYYPPAVTRELYWRVQAGLTARRVGHGGRRGRRFSNVLQHIARCDCGRVMTYVDKGDSPKGGRYLVCDGFRRGLGCPSASGWWRYDRAEAIVIKGARRLNVDAVLNATTGTSEAEARLATLRAELAEETAKRDRLVDALGDVKDSAIIQHLRTSADIVGKLLESVSAAEAETAQAAAVGNFTNHVEAVAALSSAMAALDGDQLFEVRARLAQELRRVFTGLTFLTNTILADFTTQPGKVSTFAWLRRVPLIVSEQDLAFAIDEVDTGVELFPSSRIFKD